MTPAAKHVLSLTILGIGFAVQAVGSILVLLGAVLISGSEGAASFLIGRIAREEEQHDRN